MVKDIALLSPIFTTLFWGLIFFIQVGKTDKSKINLGILMLMAFVLYISHAIFFSNFYKIYLQIEFVYIFSMLSLYPIYYLYLISLSTNKIVFSHFAHFIPALVFSVSIFILTTISTPEERIIYVKEILIHKNLKELNLSTLVGIKGSIFYLSRIVLIIQIIYYLTKGVFVAKKHNQQIANYYSNMEGITLNWVKSLNITFLFIALSSITFAIIGRGYFTQHEAFLLIPSVLFTTFLFIIGFNGNHQIQVTAEFRNNEQISDTAEITNGQPDILKNQLVQLFEEDKIYKNSDLRITLVSETLKTNRTYISKLINAEFKKNFNEFVNEYRIEEAKKLLLDKSQNLYTIEHIAEKSGFGSVNSFTRVFKEIVGMPPGKYKELVVTGQKT